jgi:hypothetical protein
MTTQTLHLIDEYLTQGGYMAGIDGVTLYDEAHLVAAAPDLLQTLQWLVCEADEDMPSECRSDSFTNALDAAIAAITKAKGA